MKGYLLINLGTPDSTSNGDVRRYLREFLSDPRVIDLPSVARWLLLNFVILPFRPQKAAAAYRKIWTKRGSPLLFHGQDLRDAVADRMPPGTPVALGMRYASPSLSEAFDELLAAGADEIVALPLFPQYTKAAWASAAAKLYDLAAAKTNVPSVRVIAPFWEDSGFIEACAAQARAAIEAGPAPDVVLLSYHGIPEHHCSEAAPDHCFSSSSCCDEMVAANKYCYRAQCFATSRLLAKALGLEDGAWEVAFQSRMGRRPWIRPYTDLRVTELAKGGARRIVVLEPSFTADCLETIEEIGIRARQDFEANGPEAARLDLAPCVNATDPWADTVVRLLTT